MNNNDQVIWRQPGAGGIDQEIFLYSGGMPVPLTNDLFRDDYIAINDAGFVVWVQFDGIFRNIFLFDGNGIHQVTDTFTDIVQLVINGSGDIAFRGFDTENESLGIFLVTHSSVIPEPSTLLLLTSGLIGLAVKRRIF